MIDLSIIIVNYNVRQFVLQCLHSIYSSQLEQYSLEVIVVDNHSTDGSVEAIRQFYPQVHLIANESNPGFSKANNQGIAISNGQYILLLNPDTVIGERTLLTSLDAMRSDSAIGALGVKMIDGTGKFLPESKRSFPTPWNSFTKLTGLSSLFPNSKWLGGYNLTYLSKDKPHDIDVLCGAYMMMSHKAIVKAGVLDEDFFMYGEDIDLSYRIKQAGYKIKYLANTTIIHYKGESTKKSSLNYVKTFYSAMIIYVKKHYSGGVASLFVLLLSMAIYFRALLSLLARAWSRVKYVLLDGLFIWGGLQGIKYTWARYYFDDVEYFESSPMDSLIWVYTIIWILFLSLYGHYSRFSSIKTWLRGLTIGTALILIIYALLPSEYRSSRAVILIGTVLTVIVTYTTTLWWNRRMTGKWTLQRHTQPNILLLANAEEGHRLNQILRKTFDNVHLIHTAAPAKHQQLRLQQFPEVDEVIFSTADYSYHQVIDTMQQYNDQYQYKIAGNSSIGIIGSNSRDDSGEYYTTDPQYRLTQAYSLRQKRVFDVWSSTLLLLLFPITLLLNKLRWRSIKNTWSVLTGHMTWVGYIPIKGQLQELPALKPSVISLDRSQNLTLYEVQQQKLNQQYAQYYEPWDDQVILLQNLHTIHLIY